MNIQEHEVADLDTLDPDVLEKIENARDKVLEEVEKAENAEKQSVGVRVQCMAIAEFIDTLWGDGTAAKIFEGKTNLLRSMQAFDDIICGLNVDTEKQTKEIKNIAQKYSSARIKRK